MAKRQRTPVGGRYRVLVGLTYPTDPEVILRIQDGGTVPAHSRGLKRAEPGEIVDDLPEASLPWLVEQGMVEPVGETHDTDASAGAPAGAPTFDDAARDWEIASDEEDLDA